MYFPTKLRYKHVFSNIKSKGREMQSKNNTKTCVIEEKTEELDETTLCGRPSQIDPLVNKVGVQRYQKDPPSLIYQMYLNPPSSSY